MEFLDDLDSPQEEKPTPAPGGDPVDASARVEAAEFEPVEETQLAQPSARRKPGNGGCVFDVLSCILLGGCILVFILTLLIFRDPYTPLNPYPPDTPIPTIYIPSATPTPTEPVRLPGTWTPTITDTPTSTLTPTNTLTLTPTDTGTPLPPTATVPNSAYNYLLRGSPSYLSGSVMHPEEGCKLWIAGQAFDMKGSPVIGITVEMGGTLNNKNVYLLSLTGTGLQYGPGGYEFTLADQAVNSKESVWVQLLNQEEVPISERVYFNTFEGCDKNLILINFKQVK